MYCHNCGKKIEDTDKFCPYCGYRTDDFVNYGNFDARDQTEESEESNSKNQFSGEYIGIIIMVFFLIIGGIFLGVKYLNHENNKALEASIKKQEENNAAKEQEIKKREQEIAKRKEEEERKKKERQQSKKKKPALAEFSNEDYILPEVDTRIYTKEEINSLSKEQIFYAKNEIYARHGRKFDMEELDRYFSGKTWYVPRLSPDEFDQYGDSFFSEYEIVNRDALIKRERELNEQ